MQPHDIGDKNVERLVGASYKPAPPDPEFVARLNASLQAAARTMAPPPQADAERLRTLRWRLGWAMAAAALVAGVALVLHALDRPAAAKRSFLADDVVNLPAGPRGPRGVNMAGQALVALAQPRPAGITEARVAIGADLATQAGQRRRVTLADGSVLFLNGDTHVHYVADRQIQLLHGELYVEVSPREAGSGATFIVKTPDREVQALGTRFGVWAEGVKSGVVVAQGKVHVSGLESLVLAGQQLAPGASAAVPAPRLTHVLDWTRDLMVAAESPLVPCGDHAGGALIAVDPNGQEMRLSLRKYIVDVHIEDGFARTTIDQTYFNETWGRLEGTFYFPLPPDAVLSRLAMYVKDGSDCRLMEGGMAERDHARNVYETILHTRRDPALLEWVDGSTFKMRVFPLEAREEKRVLLSYTQKLSTLYGTTRYRFPAGHSMEAVGAWSFEARVKHGAALRCASASHPEMKSRVEGGDMVLGAQGAMGRLKDDVTLEIHDGAAEGRAEDVARFATMTHEGSQYLMLRYRPRMAGLPKRERRDWAFLYEASASRDPLLARAQIDVIRGLLENVEHDDTFTLLAAGTRLRVFDDKARLATPANVKEAVKFLEGVQLIGALDLGQALTALEPSLKTAKNPHLVHVGSGIATIGERRDNVLVQKIPQGTKYVGVGVGKRWGRAFMKLAADQSGGFFTQINPDEPIGWKAFELLATLNTPRIMAVRVVDNDERVRFLTDAATLAQGEEICAVTRIDLGKNQGLPTSAAFTGTLDGKPFVKELKVEKVAGDAGYLPRQWAKLELDRLLAEDAEKNKARIIELSKQSYVMTPFTSLLVLETEADYAKFNVDRGRKDHWAMYKCPERIAVVYEPGRDQPAAKHGLFKGDPRAVLQSILIRVPLVACYSPSPGTVGSSSAITADNLVYVVPQESRPEPQRFSFAFSNAPWYEVLEFVSKVTDLPLISTIRPTGSVNFTPAKGPDGKPKQYSAAEIIDILNEAMAPQKFMILRRQASFILMATDEPVDPTLIGRTRIEDLHKYGKTEVVKITYALKNLGAENIAPTIKTLLGPLGQVLTMEGNRLILIDTANNLSNAVEAMGKIEWGGAQRPGLRPRMLQVTDEEFGSEIGLPPPILFNRGNVGAKGAAGISPRRLPYTIEALPDLGALINRDSKSVFGGMGGNGPFTGAYFWRGGHGTDGLGGGYLGGSPTGFGGLGRGTNPVRSGEVGTSISKTNPFYYYFASPLLAGYGPSVNLVPQNSLTFSTGEPTKLITGRGTFGAAMANKTVKLWLSYREEQDIPQRFIEGDFKSNLPVDWVAGNQQLPSLLYQRPVFTADPRYFGDLLQYAPGMQATLADIEATLEAEANPKLAAQSGTVAAAARKIVEKASTAEWFQIAVPAEGRQPAYVLFFNGLGHFACERVLACGLRERVICDGTTLWHLYPEIGVGAQRQFSRFHRAEFSAAIPWLLPPVEELARGADVTLVDAHTIALVPRGDESFQTHLRFDDGGRLMERQVVRMPAKTVVYRQCYAADGTVTLEGETQGKVLATAKLQVASAQAPTLNPTTGDLVIVPMPLRTATYLQAAFPGDSTQLEEEPAIRLAASYCASGKIGLALELVCRRFFARGDRRIGFYVLLASSGSHLEPTIPYSWVDADKGTLCDVVADHPRVPLATYLAYHFAAPSRSKTEKVRLLGDIGGPSDGFLQRLGQFRDLLSAWQNSRLAEGDEPARTKLRETTLQFIGKSPLPDFDWALLDTMLQGHVAVDPKLHEAMIAAAKRAGESIGLSYGVRYEMARGLWKAGHREEARKAWRQLYEDTLKAGHLPPIEGDFRTALNEAGPAFDDLVREAAATFVQRGQGLQTLALAWQVHQLGSTELANDLVGRCVQGAEPGAVRNLARLGVVHFYVQTSQPVRADTLLKLVLAEEPFRKNAALWRLASQLAAQRGQLARSVAELEFAMDLEFANLPAVVDLQHVRSDYNLLLTHYQQFASAMVLLEKQVPAEFVTKVVRAADRWRSLDPDPEQVCQMTAKILQTVGAMDLAWDYLTTPMGLLPNESAPWLNLARVLQGDGYLDLADKAFALAFDAEPTNAQILWDRAENLQQMSRVEDARAVYRVLAEGTWQPRFQWIQNEARKK